MRPVAIKVCGITRVEDAERAVELGASALGFVLWPRSPRAVPAARAASIARAVPAGVRRVGVFVNPSPDDVARAVAAIGLDAVQLHGDEPASEFAGVGAALVKAVALSGESDVEAAAAVPEDVTVLVDASDRERRGGTGRQANWALAARLSARRPVWLAGGLTAENVGEAIATVRPALVDVSSGVESAPGLKDSARLAAFFAAVREARREAL